MGLGPQFICLFTFRGKINLERLTTDLMTLAESQSIYSGETPIYAFASDHLYTITSGKKSKEISSNSNSMNFWPQWQRWATPLFYSNQILNSLWTSLKINEISNEYNSKQLPINFHRDIFKDNEFFVNLLNRTWELIKGPSRINYSSGWKVCDSLKMT